jgi:lipid A 3-O-deacylase
MRKFGYLMFLVAIFLFGSSINAYGYQEEGNGGPVYGPEFELEYMAPADEHCRDIDTISLNIFKESHNNGRAAFYKGIILTRAWGDMTRLGVTSDCAAYGIGPIYLVRLGVMKWNTAALYLDMSGALILWDDNFPTNGDIYDFMWRIGPKFSCQIGEYTLNIGYKLMHVSNGQWDWSRMEPTEHNPSYNARGFSLTVVHDF